MRATPTGTFWGLLVLAPVQAAFAASVLCETAWVWGVSAGGYLLWLACHAARPSVSGVGLFAGGYLLPLAAFSVTYAALAMPTRPETAEAWNLLRPPAAAPPPAGSDMPVPRLRPARSNRDVARGVWLLIATFLYLAACATAGLLWHTPTVLYLAALVAAAVAFRLPEGSP